VIRRGTLAALALALTTACGGGCQRRGAAEPYDPLAGARAAPEAPPRDEPGIPPQCYAVTAGRFNPCWNCHTKSLDPTSLSDWELQREYAFSQVARTNPWTNLFAAPPAGGADEREILAWVREDNYRPLRAALAAARNHPGFVPDLDLDRGFDARGFARDGSGWRVVRYKPFPGVSWPGGGSLGDLFVRLPPPFRHDRHGRESPEIYRINLAILEAAVGSDPRRKDGALDREVEPLDERAVDLDPDGDGRLGMTNRIRALPSRYVGQAGDVAVKRHAYPLHAELLHSVRYLDPDAPGFAARRMKELRYARKVQLLDTWAALRSLEQEQEEKDEGKIPVHAGSPVMGLRSRLGWQLQGFIEDAEGRLRLQTREEHRACMGCHGGIGVTVDGTFALPRKLPGAAGWRPQSLVGMPDAPQAGHTLPEGMVYLSRAGGGDAFRGDPEMEARFLADGTVRAAEVLRAGPGGDRDLAWLLLPSRARALALASAYRELARRQAFGAGRDALPPPPGNVHRRIEATSTGLDEKGLVFGDGRLHLDWSAHQPGADTAHPAHPHPSR
jgi:hypothetical protein